MPSFSSFYTPTGYATTLEPSATSAFVSKVESVYSSYLSEKSISVTLPTTTASSTAA